MITMEVGKDVREIVQKYDYRRDYLLAIIKEVVDRKKYLTEALVKEIAIEMDISATEVFSVASFYYFINTKPVGKYIIRICKTISCELAGKNEIIKALEKELRIKVGQTTYDQKFTLETTSCLGLCYEGPVMLVNDEPYSKLDPQKALEIIREYNKK